MRIVVEVVDIRSEWDTCRFQTALVTMRKKHIMSNHETSTPREGNKKTTSGLFVRTKI